MEGGGEGGKDKERERKRAREAERARESARAKATCTCTSKGIIAADYVYTPRLIHLCHDSLICAIILSLVP